MTSRIPFDKYSATGNDFILFDNRTKVFRGDETALFEKLCTRKTGIGADGILLIETPRAANCDFTMRYFNRDGRESEMCGNGARASAYHAASMQLAPHAMRFEVSGEVYHAWVEGNEVRLLMQTPRDLRLRPGVVSSLNYSPLEGGVTQYRKQNELQGKSNTPLTPLKGGMMTKDGMLQEAGFVNTGVPHYVLFAANVDQINVETIGRDLRHHPAFAPAGTNVNFAERLAPARVKLRTYERGVEEETLACGTGATAAALFTHLIHGDAFPIHIQTCGGELLVNRGADTERFMLHGRVERVFTGELELCK
jgi:diaminopimelate epimerase